MSEPSERPAPLRAVLFDLDGTLADTAPDLAAAINQMRSARGLPLAPYETLRPLASRGARGLLGGAFGIDSDHPDFAAMQAEFLAYYAARLCVETTLFPGIRELLDELSTRSVRWGIVTNKVSSLARPLAGMLGLSLAQCIVGGDTTPYAKPHPAPLLYAARQLGLPPEHITYVGDDLRDIQAGRAARMFTIAVSYGYGGQDALPGDWQADRIASSVAQLHALLKDC